MKTWPRIVGTSVKWLFAVVTVVAMHQWQILPQPTGAIWALAAIIGLVSLRQPGRRVGPRSSLPLQTQCLLAGLLYGALAATPWAEPVSTQDAYGRYFVFGFPLLVYFDVFQWAASGLAQWAKRIGYRRDFLDGQNRR